MSKLDPRKLIPEFQFAIVNATSCEDMLSASMEFISFHGGFSGSPEARAKFIANMPSRVRIVEQSSKSK